MRITFEIEEPKKRELEAQYKTLHEEDKLGVIRGCIADGFGIPETFVKLIEVV